MGLQIRKNNNMDNNNYMHKLQNNVGTSASVFTQCILICQAAPLARVRNLQNNMYNKQEINELSDWDSDMKII